MLYSKIFGKTNKTAKEYGSLNATLLQKAGFIEQTMAGVYTFLFLGVRVLNKIENIIKDEMNMIANEVIMPCFSSMELWEKSGRIKTMDVLFKAVAGNELSKSKHDAEYMLNSTHEEVLMPIAMNFNRSYKDFPFAVYQIQTKFRNEPRAKSGLLRGREFRMKDAYSFHTSVDDMKDYYEKSKEVYTRIFNRLGIGNDTYIAQASGGAFTDDFSHEFQTRCDAGEDDIFFVPSKKIAFNKEIAPSKAPIFDQSFEEQLDIAEVDKEGLTGVEALVDYLNIPIEKAIKTMIFETDEGKLVAAVVRGDYEVNEDKLLKVVGCKSLSLAPADVIKEVTGAEIGYAGIVDMPEEVTLYIDDAVSTLVNFETGGNRTGVHMVNVNFDRDVQRPDKFYDIKIAKEGDIYPETGEPYEFFHASEVGNIFPLYTKYSDSFGYKFVDKDGKEKPVVMGCYGIGSSRVMGIIAEKFNDDKGLIWPKQIAPFHVHVIGLDLKKDDIKKVAYQVYKDLLDKSIEVLFDDRVGVSPGEKFKDADLIGLPFRVVVSKRTGDKVEFKRRVDEKSELYSLDKVIEIIQSELN
jgi:prolyl-tRNA synthetase